jgi:hypothetical protein
MKKVSPGAVCQSARAVTAKHQPDGLNQETFTFSQLWRPEHEIKVWAGLVFPEAFFLDLQEADVSPSPHWPPSMCVLASSS